MIQGQVNQDIPASVNFLGSRSGLTTVGYTLVDQNHDVIVARRSTGVVELVVAGNATGLYTTTINFPQTFIGYIVWDTGQDPDGVGSAKLRSAIEDVIIDSSNNGTTQILDAVGALYEENTMKIPNGPVPSSVRIVRKRPGAANWTNPYSDATIPVVNKPGDLRYGGPPLSP